MLHDFIARHRDEILLRSRQRASLSAADGAFSDEACARFLDEVVDALRDDASGLSESRPPHELAALHGRDVADRGASITELAHHFGALSDAVSGLAAHEHVPVTPREWQIVNQKTDEAIACAIAAYWDLTTEREKKLLAEHIGGAAHELRNSLAAAMLSYRAIRDGKVPIAGRTGQILERSLRRASELVSDMLVEARLNSGEPPSLRRVQVDDLVSELAAPAIGEGACIIIDVEPGLEVIADLRLLASAFGNVINNAVKYTKRGGAVAIRGRREGANAVVEVEDECGGLVDDPETLLRPFVQSSSDRTGLGLGLTIVKRAVEAHSGELTVRNLPGKGCIFAVVIPQRPAE